MKPITIAFPKTAVAAGKLEDAEEGDAITITVVGTVSAAENGALTIDATKVTGDSKPSGDDDEDENEDGGAQATEQNKDGQPANGSGEAQTLAREIGEAKGGPAVAYVLGMKRKRAQGK